MLCAKRQMIYGRKEGTKEGRKERNNEGKKEGRKGSKWIDE